MEREEVLQAGATIAGYKVRQRLGQGPVGSVWAAIQPSTGHKVAVKVLHPDHAENPDIVERFEEAVERGARMHGPHVVRVLARGRLDSGIPYAIEEFAHGQRLDEVLAETGSLSESKALSLLRELVEGLEAARDQEARAGNFKPENVFLVPRPDGSWPPRAQLSDFGMTHVIEPRRAAPGADVKTLGAIAYQLVHGAPCDRGESEEAEPEPRPAPEVSDETQTLILWLMAQRATSLAEVRQALDELIAIQPQEEPAPPREEPTERPAAEVLATAEEDPPAEAPAPDASAPPAPQTVRGDPLASTAQLPRWRGRGVLRHTLRAAVGLAMILGAGVLSYRFVVGSWPGAAHSAPVLHGKVRVVTQPAGALVHLDHVQLRQRTPVTLSVTRGKPYQLEVYLRGYRPWRQRLALGVDEPERTVELPLARRDARWGTLQLSASRKADFFLDTRRVGTQTKQVTLAEIRAGVAHHLRVRWPGGREVERRVRVKPGKVLVLDFDLPAR